MPIDPDAAGVGPAQRHRFCHFRDDVPVCIEIAIEANPTSYAAHRVTLSDSWVDRPPSIGSVLRSTGLSAAETPAPAERKTNRQRANGVSPAPAAARSRRENAGPI
jgi:hypothetical protein